MNMNLHLLRYFSYTFFAISRVVSNFSLTTHSQTCTSFNSFVYRIHSLRWNAKILKNHHFTQLMVMLIMVLSRPGLLGNKPAEFWFRHQLLLEAGKGWFALLPLPEHFSLPGPSYFHTHTGHQEQWVNTFGGRADCFGTS